MQAGQTGHYVLSTIHTIDSIEVITRLKKMGVSNYDISSTLATSVSQRLVRKVCPNCSVERDFNEKEIIQIIGGSYEEVNKINDFIERKETGTDSITESYIIHHAEYRWRKGRSKDFVDCPNWEMPLFNCISDYMLEEIHKNSEASNKMSNVFEEMFGEALTTVTFDSNGNVAGIEKVIQEISVKELIKNYKGNFIKELRKGNVFSEEKVKIKKLKDNVYCILNEDNKEGEKIYKKIS